MSNYAYLKEVELQDGTVLPFGHYNISTWSSTTSAVEHAFEITLDSTASMSRGVLNVTCVTQTAGCAIIAIPLNYSRPCSTYKVLHDDGIIDNIKYVSENTQKATYKIKCKNSCICNVSLQEQVSCNITAATNASSATTAIQKCEQLNILRDGTDYGTTLPAAGNVGRLFFVKV